MAELEPGVQVASGEGRYERPMTTQEVIDLQDELRKKNLQPPQFYPSQENPDSWYKRRPTTRERMDRAKEWRQQQDDDPNFERPQHWDPGKSPPRAEAPSLSRMVGEELGAAWEREPKFAKNLLGMATGPYQAAKSVLARGAQGKIGAESVTGAESMALPGYLAGQYPRAAAGSLGVAGGAPKKVLDQIREIRGAIANLHKSRGRLAENLKIMQFRNYDDPMVPAVQRFLEEADRTIALHEEQLREAMDMAAKQYGPDFWKGKPTGELGVAGGRPPGGTRGSNFLGASPNAVKRFWERYVAYRGNIEALAKAEGVSEHTIRARLDSPSWPRPANMQTPQIAAQQAGLTARTPKNITTEDVKRFWQVIDRYQHLKNWRTPVQQVLGISNQALERRFKDPKWARPMKPEPAAEATGVPAPTQDQHSIDWFYGEET